MKRLVTLMLLAMTLVQSAVLHAAAPDAQTISRVTGLEPEIKDDLVTVRVPRKDLGTVVDGVKLDPFQGLTSWAAFQQAGDQTMVMGDLTLAQDEVKPAMTAARLVSAAVHRRPVGHAGDEPVAAHGIAHGSGCPG